MRVVMEIGPKGKKMVATAWDWPGLERNGTSEDEALEKLDSYLPRYMSVARRARLGKALREDGPLAVAERYDGNTSTDFWGISYTTCSFDREMLPDDAFTRWLKLLKACWTEFDDTAARVSPELRKGPRGGGRDRDEIVNHVFATERMQLAKRVGVITPQGVMLTPGGLSDHRANYVEALKRAHADGTLFVGRSWTLSYLIRHTCYHLLDHAWEMQDKDLTGQES